MWDVLNTLCDALNRLNVNSKYKKKILACVCYNHQLFQETSTHQLITDFVLLRADKRVFGSFYKKKYGIILTSIFRHVQSPPYKHSSLIN